ncbi:MAG: Lon protease family protein [Thermoplasmata archaeon]|nr:MAG: Lon protease family protein [Thermoplasmata archaeon]
MAKDSVLLDAKRGFSISEIETTADIYIPPDPLERVIGQDAAIEAAKIAAKQHRHLLLVGPPGTGKSMIGQALAYHLPPPTEEIQVVHNPEKPERPFVEVKTREKVLEERRLLEEGEGELIRPEEAPINVAEKLGYRCMNCGTYSPPTDLLCPKCGRIKTLSQNQPLVFDMQNIQASVQEMLTSLFPTLGTKRVTTTRIRLGKEEVVVYEQAGPMIKVLDQEALEKRREIEKMSPRKVLVPLERRNFVLATGASETELLGDVRHDPYGSHPQLGIPPYERVIPGAIHEAHQGVLFIDELPHLGHLQRYILTAMQEKKFPIVGRNPQSSGASVRVDDVPCDFIFVGACNIQDVPAILSPLRSRIIGSGYEVLMETTVPDDDINRAKFAQFVAQEIVMDGRIPHATKDAVLALIEVARKRAKIIDGKDNALTLRLRDMGGLIRAAGDLAVLNGERYIEEKHVREAIKRSKTIEEQIKDKYGSYIGGVSTEISEMQREVSPYYYWNKYVHDHREGYG